MTSCLEFLLLVTQIALLMRFSEVPILKNDFFSGWGWGWGGGRQPLLLIATFLYLTIINAPSFGQVWIKMIAVSSSNSSTSTKWFLVFHCS